MAPFVRAARSARLALLLVAGSHAAAWPEPAPGAGSTPVPGPLPDSSHSVTAPAPTPVLCELRPAGALTPPQGAPFTPGVTAIDPRGRILVADQARGTIYVWDGTGPPRGWLAGPSDRSGLAPRFVDVRAIVAGSGLNIYVLDGGSGQVYAFDLSWQSRGVILDLTGATVLDRFGRLRPSALAIDPTGQAAVGDRSGQRMIVFDPNWAPSHELWGPGRGPAGLRDPAAIAFARDGRGAVADRGNRRVQYFDATGAWLAEYPVDRAPESVVFDARGGLWIGDAGGGITRIGRRGARQSWPPNAGESGAVFLALSGDGRRLVASRPVAGRVDLYDIQDAPATPGR